MRLNKNGDDCSAAEPLEVVSERLSHLLAAASTLAQADKILADAGISAVRQPVAQSSASSVPRPDAIGIWQARQENGQTWYVRRADDPTASFWANVERLGPKSQNKRVLLLGESVARAIFYDPVFNAATALQAMLRSVLGESIEVIDLARVDMTLYELSVMTRSALALEPDAIVIFAGNNWRFPAHAADFELLEQAARSIQASGNWEAITSQLQEQIRSNTGAFLRQLSRIAMDRDIPIVFVLPEFNLTDWTNEFCGQVPLAGSDEAAAWEALRGEAEANLKQGNLAAAETAARRMISIDRGMLPRGYEIVAHCRLAMGDTVAARNFLELARDSSHALPVNLAPRCYSVIQETLRREAPRHNVRLIDLPQLFAVHSRGELPGRALFLDYCHLTRRGLQLAMAAVTRELVSSFQSTSGNISWEALLTVIPADRMLEAHAHFLAAVHNARCGQDHDIVRYHCDTALREEPAMARTMRLYLGAHLQPVPLIMTRAFHEMAPFTRMMLGRHIRPAKQIDINLTLVDAILKALAEMHAGVMTETSKTLKRLYSVGTGETDLLRAPFCCPALNKAERGWEYRTTHFTAYSRYTEVWFVGDPLCVTQLRLTCRVPNAGPNDRIQIRVNGELVFSASASTTWQESIFFITGERIRESATTLVIEWPAAQRSREDRIKDVVQSIEQGPLSGDTGGFPNIFTIYGELQTLTATTDVHVAGTKTLSDQTTGQAISAL